MADELVPPWHAKDTVQYSFENHRLDLGLPGTVITAAVQARDGYLWVATPLGLGRFDGVRFVPFPAADTPGLPSDLIHCLREDRQGVLWIGTDKGLARVLKGRFAAAGLAGKSVHAITEDDSGNLWVGTWGDGVHVLRPARAEFVRVPGLPPDLRVHTLLADSQGQVWVAPERARGLWRIGADGTAQPFDEGHANLGEVLTIAESPKACWWFGTKRDGLFRLKEGQLTRQGLAEGIGSTPIYELRAARQGGLWLATGALVHVAVGERPVFTTIPGVPNRNVLSVCEDREGGVWLCAGAEGLARMRELPYRLFSARQGLPTDNVKNVTEDAHGELWLATQGSGVVRVGREGGVTSKRSNAGPPDGDPAVVYATRDGSVWAAATSLLWRWQNGEWRQHPALRSVRGLHEDRLGALWVGTESDGLFRVTGDRIVEIKTAAGARVPFATSFAEAPDGAVLVGTWRSGVWRVAPGGTLAVEWARGLPSNDVRALHVDRDGRLWVGLSNRGLAVWENDQCLNPPAVIKALGSSVSAILEEDSGRLWLGNLAGLAWANKDELLAWMRAPASAPPIHAMPVGDETGIIPVWSGGQPVATRATNGDLLFATRRGVLAVDPSRVTLNTLPPPVEVERVFVDRHPVESGAPVRLPPGTRSLGVEFAAPSFVQADRVLFRYKLEGYDADWVDAAARRSAFYGSLPPGEFTFRVRACNNDGVWNETGAALAITQLPYFYQTTWFAWLLAGVVVTGGWGAYRWSNRRLRRKVERLERERAMDDERRRIAQDLHDDLGASLTEIGLFADAARRTDAAAKEAELDYLARRARTLVGSLDAIVWTVNPANDSLDHLVGYVGELFQELFRASPIRARLDLPTGIPRLPLTAEERADIFLTTKEAMNNVLKHSGATEAALRVKVEAQRLEIALRDNGRGFDPAAAAANGGNGLANMRTRIARVGGTLTWRTAPGQGTEIVIVVSFAGRKELPENS